MKLDSFIHYVHTELMPGVELYVYALKGTNYSVLLDTGIASMKPDILELCREVDTPKFVLISHAHADHIGCNGAVKAATGAHFAAAGALSWLEDYETHYREFCRTDALPDSDAQRQEILALMDTPAQIDLLLSPNTVFRLGEGIELLTLALPGHKLEEVGFLEVHTGTLFLADVFLALAAPFFHGFQTSVGLYKSLARLEELIEVGRVTRVFSSHHHPMQPEQALEAIAATRTFLDDVESVTLGAATGIPFKTLWQTVCATFDKQEEFRGYAMLEVQVRELQAAGRLRQEDYLLIAS